MFVLYINTCQRSNVKRLNRQAENGVLPRARIWLDYYSKSDNVLNVTENELTLFVSGVRSRRFSP